MKKTILFFVSAVFSLFFILDFIFVPSGSSSQTYSLPITINNLGVSLTDYQINVSLDTATPISAGKMRPDCGDLRFTDSSNFQLSYWIQSGCNSASTIVWVKVPNIAASSAKTIYA